MAFSSYSQISLVGYKCLSNNSDKIKTETASASPSFDVLRLSVIVTINDLLSIRSFRLGSIVTRRVNLKRESFQPERTLNINRISGVTKTLPSTSGQCDSIEL